MDEISFIALFTASFASATFLPGASEVGVLAMLSHGREAWAVLAVATAGNSLGSIFTYFLGYWGKLEWAAKFCRVDLERVMSFQAKVKKYGSFLSVFCFLPVIGDPLAFALGYFKSPKAGFIIWMTVGKFLRFFLIYLAFEGYVML